MTIFADNTDIPLTAPRKSAVKIDRTFVTSANHKDLRHLYAFLIIVKSKHIVLGLG